MSLTSTMCGLPIAPAARASCRKRPNASALDASKTKFGENDAGKLLGDGVTYGSQSYYMPEHEILYSSGSYGQIGYSDMMTGVAVVFLQDWAVNAELEKFFASRDRALAIIYHLRAKANPGFMGGHAHAQ